MIIVSDTSSVSALFRVGKLHLLESLFGRIILPQSVWEELKSLEHWGYDPLRISNLAWIEIQSAKDGAMFRKLLNQLDPGEAEAIALAKELNADLLLIDEMKGRQIALSEGLQIVGLLGVLLRAKNQGLLDSYKAVIDELVRVTQFRISTKLLDEMLVLAGEK